MSLSPSNFGWKQLWKNTLYPAAMRDRSDTQLVQEFTCYFIGDMTYRFSGYTDVCSDTADHREEHAHAHWKNDSLGHIGIF